MKQVVVIGAGPAGMMAAIAAAENGCQVTIYEKNKIVGKKLLITGKGRCNLTNNCPNEEFLKNVPVNGRFLFSAVSRFSPQDTMAFFERLGVKLKTERGNRVFPQSDRSAEIAGALKSHLHRLGIRVINQPVKHILMENGTVSGVLPQDGEEVPADAVILATGGVSYPLTGSTGDGYRMAEALGHTVIAQKPSLVPLLVEGTACGRMAGLALKNVSVTVEDTETGKNIYTDFGELLFTHEGISGPMTLSASSHIREMAPGRYRIHLDLKPALSEKQLDARLLREFDANKNKDIGNVLLHLLPSGMVPVFLETMALDGARKVNIVTKEERNGIIAHLKKFSLTVSGFAPIEEAIVTSGGVRVEEINPKTMESKLVKGLYFAGEIIDVDAYTGGFNLQIAFSTGYAAGSSL